jgi:glycerol-3-phosphate acyltransferase PlsY
LGSGNIGSANVGRVCGPKGAAAVFSLDVLKGLLPPLAGAALRLDSCWQVAAAILAIVGHNYSVWLGFKGGKGIATSLGAMVGVAIKVVPPVGGLFMLELVTLRYVSLGSILGAVALPVSTVFLYPRDNYRLAFASLACIMALYRHRANIGRLRAGTEPKVRLPWDKERADTGEMKP